MSTCFGYCGRYKVDTGDTVYVYENSNKSLARKKSSVSVLFKQLYRDELLDKNITDGFRPDPRAASRRTGDQGAAG